MNISQQSKITIPNPCPFVLKAGDKNELGFHCKSCVKTVVDYRGKSIEELNSCVSKDVCGIFDSDQLQQAPTFSFSRRILFNILTVCSFLGFSVPPVSAQVHESRTTIQTETKVDEVKLKSKNELRKTQRLNKRRKRRRKRHGTRTIGCPSF